MGGFQYVVYSFVKGFIKSIVSSLVRINYLPLQNVIPLPRIKRIVVSQ